MAGSKSVRVRGEMRGSRRLLWALFLAVALQALLYVLMIHYGVGRHQAPGFLMYLLVLSQFIGEVVLELISERRPVPYLEVYLFNVVVFGSFFYWILGLFRPPKVVEENDPPETGGPLE